MVIRLQQWETNPRWTESFRWEVNCQSRFVVIIHIALKLVPVPEYWLMRRFCMLGHTTVIDQLGPMYVMDDLVPISQLSLLGGLTF